MQEIYHDINLYRRNIGIEVVNVIEKIEILRYVKNNIERKSKKLLELVIKNLAPTKVVGLEILKRLLENDTQYDTKNIEKLFSNFTSQKLIVENLPTYDDFEEYGFVHSYRGKFNTLYEQLKKIIANEKFISAGFYYVNERRFLNPNIFAKYVNQIVKLITLPNEMYAIYNNSGYYSLIDEFQVAKIVRDIMNDAAENSWNTKNEKEVLRAVLLSTETISKLNPDKRYLNLINGMLDIEKMVLLEHDPNYYSSIRIPVVYDKEAESPRFDRYMDEITLNDKQLKMVIQEILGDMISNKIKTEKAYFFYGGGANGKSVLAEVITRLVGKENVSNIPLRDFGKKFGLQTIVDKTINIATENELDGKNLSTEVIKAVVSGDPIHISIKYKKGLNSTLDVKLLFLVNTLPDTADNTDGYYRKILIVPFNAKFKGKNDEKGLDKVLESESSGILNFALEGLVRLSKNNSAFSECAAINKLMTQYEETQNPIITFFDEIIEVGDETFSVPKKEVIEGFKNWCHQNGLDEYTKITNLKFWKMFKLVMAKKGLNYEEKKRQGFHYLKGIKLNDAIKLGESELLLA